jgi:hypothetical protein
MIPSPYRQRREYLAFPNSFWATAQTELIYHFAGRLFGRGVLLIFFLLVQESTSPGSHLRTTQIFSNVSKLMPSALPFFNRHSVVWLIPVSLASQ